MTLAYKDTPCFLTLTPQALASDIKLLYCSRLRSISLCFSLSIFNRTSFGQASLRLPLVSVARKDTKLTFREIEKAANSALKNNLQSRKTLRKKKKNLLKKIAEIDKTLAKVQDNKKSKS